jgi:hypothetical protein
MRSIWCSGSLVGHAVGGATERWNDYRDTHSELEQMRSRVWLAFTLVRVLGESYTGCRRQRFCKIVNETYDYRFFM